MLSLILLIDLVNFVLRHGRHVLPLFVGVDVGVAVVAVVDFMVLMVMMSVMLCMVGVMVFVVVGYTKDGKIAFMTS